MGKKRHSVNAIFTIMLLGLFAITAISVALLGAQVYARTAENLQANFGTRTSIIYLSEKIRACQGEISVRDIGEEKALVLDEETDGQVYESWIYILDDSLYEAVVRQGSLVLPSAGQKIMPLESFEMALDGDGVRISVETDSGQILSTFISRRADG
jgi:hypothetical protein